MPIIPVLYPLDPTGLSPTNLVVGEVINLTVNQIRGATPIYGAFFTESAVVFDNTTGVQLVRGSQYQFVELLQEATQMYGKEICAVILILDHTVSSAIRVNLQMLGGHWQSNYAAVTQLYETVIKDNRPVDWLTLLNKPLAFNPALHQHLLQDIYGFEAVIYALERVRSAIVLSDVPAFEGLATWVTNQLVLSNTNLSNHFNNVANPHHVSATQVGLGNVENLIVATSTEMINELPIAGSTTRKYITLDNLILWKATALAGTVAGMNIHIASVANPHATTKAQVGLGTVEDLPVVLAGELQGLGVHKYVTHDRLVTYMTGNTSIISFTDHIANVSNPHVTTKAQVGLGNVANYLPLLQADIVAGVGVPKYVTFDMLLSYMSTSGFNASITTHVGRLDNPHATTAAQVGLGNVSNLPIVTALQVNNRTNVLAYVTFDMLMGYINADATSSSLISHQNDITSLSGTVGTLSGNLGSLNTTTSTHITNAGNPHTVTKAQVGLGNVSNLPVVTLAQIQADNPVSAYVTHDLLQSYVRKDKVQVVVNAASLQWNALNGNCVIIYLSMHVGISLPTNLAIGTYTITFVNNGGWDVWWSTEHLWPDKTRPVIAKGVGELTFVSMFWNGSNMYGSYAPNMGVGV